MEKALQFSLLLARDIVAIHLTRLDETDDGGGVAELRRQWRHDVDEATRCAGFAPPKLVLRSHTAALSAIC